MSAVEELTLDMVDETRGDFGKAMWGRGEEGRGLR